MCVHAVQVDKLKVIVLSLLPSCMLLLYSRAIKNPVHLCSKIIFQLKEMNMKAKLILNECLVHVKILIPRILRYWPLSITFFIWLFKIGQNLISDITSVGSLIRQCFISISSVLCHHQ